MQEIRVNDRAGSLYNELFSESKKENVRPFKVWLGPLRLVPTYEINLFSRIFL